MADNDSSTHIGLLDGASLEALLAAAPLGMALLDREGRYVKVNPALAALNGVPLEEHFGRTLESVVPHMASAISPMVRQVRATGEAVLNHQITDADGDGRSWLATYYPVCDDEGEVAGVGTIVLETTDLRRIEAELLQKSRALEVANLRLQLLARAGAVLGSSLEIETTLQSVANLAVPDFADWCFVDLKQGEGLRRVASAHADARNVQLAHDFQRYYRVRSDARHGNAYVLTTGEMELQPAVTPEIIHEIARDAAHEAALQALQMKSYISAPLRARGEIFGVVTFVICATSEHARRAYDENDAAFAGELAVRAAVAIDNARLYRQAQEARSKSEAARAASEDATRAKDEFLSLLSHELRTPLTSACGWMHLLRGGRLDAVSQTMALETIDRALATQSRLVNELIDTSRIASGRLQLETGPLLLAPLVRQTMLSLQPAAIAREIEISLQLDETIQVRGDAGRIQQIVWNILSNAVKFTSAGDSVEITLQARGTSARLSVKDSGIGIAPPLLPHVFERFWQADASATRTHGGLGLGLSIARYLAELHGGTLQAYSDGENQGAMFELSLPSLDSTEKVANHKCPTPASGAGKLLDGLRILVLEDEDDSRSWMEVLLRGNGAIVDEAPDMRSALDCFLECRPDVIVSDISLPDGDGYMFLAHVRELERERDTSAGTPFEKVPAIALTARTAATDRLRALSAGFQIHIPKPVDPGELLLTVASLAGRSIHARV
ncbi:MAG TPA: ATP-binding protein [Abditibacteriaceae bacterium]|jgi:PAS domain S-box-containing protein